MNALPCLDSRVRRTLALAVVMPVIAQAGGNGCGPGPAPSPQVAPSHYDGSANCTDPPGAPYGFRLNQRQISGRGQPQISLIWAGSGYPAYFTLQRQDQYGNRVIYDRIAGNSGGFTDGQPYVWDGQPTVVQPGVQYTYSVAESYTDSGPVEWACNSVTVTWTRPDYPYPGYPGYPGGGGGPLGGGAPTRPR